MSIGSRFVAAAALVAAVMFVPSMLSTTAQAQCGGRWIGPSRGTLEPNGAVSEIGIWDPDGPGPSPHQLVAAGTFTNIAETPVAGLGIYDGDEWRTLGGGVTGTVNAFATLPDGRLVVAGSITQFGTDAFINIATWDGERWEGLGSGLSGTINALLVMDDGSLIAGGRFTTAGGVPALRLARWDGQAWSQVGGGVSGGVNSSVTALAQLPNGSLAVAGQFNRAGTTTVSGIATWNGTTWAPIGPVTSQSPGINAMVARPDGTIVVSGTFYNIGGLLVDCIAMWNGSNWTNIDLPGANGPHFDLGMRSTGEIIAVGSVGVVGRLNGSTWTFIENNIRGSANKIAVFPNGDLVLSDAVNAGSLFGFTSTGLLRWRESRQHWDFPGEGVYGWGYTLQNMPDGSTFYGGVVSGAGGVQTLAGAFRTNDGWIGTGVQRVDPIRGSAVVNGSLFIVHQSERPPVGLDSVARWNGTSWETVGGGLPDSNLRDCVAWDPDGDGPLEEWLVVAGTVRLPGDELVHWVARWDGETWAAMPRPSSVGSWVRLRVLSNNRLCHSTDGGMSIYNPEGEGWDSITTTSSVQDMLSLENGELVLAGRFSRIAGYSISNIARQTGGLWTPLGAGVNGPIDSIQRLSNDRIFAAGQFTQAGEYPVNGTAIWNGDGWEQTGNTFRNAYFYDLETLSNGDIAVSIYFGSVDGRAVGGFARYRETRTPAVTLEPAPRLVRAGDEVHFSVQGSGDRLNYRWRRNGVNLESGGRVRGAASATLRIFAVQPDDAGVYECVLINPCGTTTSTGALLRIAPAVGSCAYDFNQDGNVDLLDAQTIAQVALSLREPDAAWLDGDVDSDGETTISDAQVLAMYVVSGVCGL
jgi:hypothetical protein